MTLSHHATQQFCSLSSLDKTVASRFDFAVVFLGGLDVHTFDDGRLESDIEFLESVE